LQKLYLQLITGKKENNKSILLIFESLWGGRGAMLPFTSLAHHHPLGGCVIGSTNRKRYPTFKTKHPTLPYLSPSKALYPNPDCEIDKVKVRCIAPNSQNTKHVLSASTQNMFSILRVSIA